MYVDSHCHLTYADFGERLPEIRAAMAAAGVDRALCICTTLEEFESVHALALAHDNFWCSVGVHPDNEDAREPSVDELVRLAALSRVVAIGETGLDYFRLEGRSVADMAWQRERFRVHIRAARAAARPLIVHTRSASADTIAVMQEEGADIAGGVFHCFTETAEVARAALDLGFYISFSGILTFKTAEALRDVARFVPLDRCLIETDSPYLAPVPFRGKVNTPALVPYVAGAVGRAEGHRGRGPRGRDEPKFRDSIPSDNGFLVRIDFRFPLQIPFAERVSRSKRSRLGILTTTDVRPVPTT